MIQGYTLIGPLQHAFKVQMRIGDTGDVAHVFTLGSSWLGWVFLSFGCIGLSLGIFECTFLNVITPMGPLTKSWAIMGFPAAFFIINVFGFLLVSFGVPVQALFWYVVLGMPVGVALFATRIAPQLR